MVTVYFMTLHSYSDDDDLDYYSSCNKRGVKMEIRGKSYDKCDCFPCYHGDKCKNSTFDVCELDLISGDPQLQQEIWIEEGKHKDVTILPPGYGNLYDLDEDLTIDDRLKDAIVQLHEMVGNAEAANKTIIIGNGGTQILQAAVLAIQAMRMLRNQSLAVTYSPTPYYADYSGYPLLNPVIGGFTTNDGSPLPPDSDIIEYVTSPNNPDGQKRTPSKPNATHIWDLVYYWPAYTDVDTKLDEDIMVFSASKCLGLAGSRIGWALVKDDYLALLMKYAMMGQTLGISVDSKTRTLTAMEAVLSKQGYYFDELNRRLETRFAEFEALLNTGDSPRFSLVGASGGFYAWIKCNWANDTNCQEVFESVGIVGKDGSAYGVDLSFVRINFSFFSYLQDHIFDKIKSLLTTP